MKLKFCTVLLTAATIIAPLSVMAEKAQDPAAAKRAAVATYGKLPLSFEPTGSSARFLARSGNYAVSVGAHESSVAVSDVKSGKHQTLHFAFENANPAAPLEAMEPQAGVTNYYLGKDASQWRLGVKSYGKLRAQGVYPGVDVIYYGDHRRLEFDFMVAPKADPGVIALSFSGMEKLSKDGSGDLVAEVGGQPVRFAKPYAYQKVGGASKAVAADYELSADGKVHFHLGDYDRNAELIVDPVVSYATYLGGSLGDSGNGIAVDGLGRAYVTGQTCSSSIANVYNLYGDAPGKGESCDAFVTKYTSDGTGYLYTTILGGSIPANATATGYGIALDASNQAYIVGTTNIEDMPGNTGGYRNNYQGGDSDAFIVILAADGTLVRSSYLGGGSADAGYSIAVDHASPANVIIVGQTCSNDFPAYNAFATKIEACVAFVTKLDNALDIAPPLASDASALTPPPTVPGKTYYFSEFFGGQPVAPYITGVWGPGAYFVPGAIIYDDTWPTPNIEITYGGGTSGALQPVWATTKLSYTQDGTVTWQNLGPTAIPPTAFTEAYGVATDPPGDVFLAGGSNSQSLASTLWPCSPGNGTGAWIIKVSGKSGNCVYSWALESNATDLTATINTARAIAVDSAGKAYVTGTASGSLLTTGNAYSATNHGGPDAFLVRMNIAGSAIDYATYLGGAGIDQGLGVAVDGSFQAYVTGATTSVDFPTINPLTNPNTGNQIPLSGSEGAFITKFTEDGSALIFSAYMGGSEADQGNAIAVAPDLTTPSFSDIYVAGDTTSPDLLKTLLLQAPTVSDPSPYIPPQPANGGNGDAFVAMIPGASIPTVTVMPGSLAFPYQNVGTTSAAQTVTYRNTNSLSTVQINSILFSSTEFQQSTGSGTPPDCSPGSQVPPLATCQIMVIFTPSAETLQTGTLTISDDATSAPHVVNLSGEGAIPADSYFPSSLQFGTQGVNTPSAKKTVTLTNTSSTGTLFVSSIVVAGTNPGDFQESDDKCIPEVAPSVNPQTPSFCTITVVFTPGAVGPRSATVTITDNAPGSPHLIPMSGTGAPIASTVTPGSLLFLQQPMNVPSTAKTITVKNTSIDPTQFLSVTSLSTTGDFQVSGNTCTQLIAASDFCTVDVIFDPTLPGTRTGTLTIAGNGTVMPFTVALSGSAGATATLCAGKCVAPPAPPAALSFTGTNVGTTSAANTVTLTNQSNFALNVHNVAIGGVAASEFSQTNNCGTSVSPNGTCTISVSFMPASTGNQNATLTVASDAALSPQSVSIIGVGTAPLVTFTSTPPMINSTLNFGSQPLNGASTALSIKLTNSGSGPLNIPVGGITIAGAVPGDFSQSNTCGTQVAAGTSCTISVTFVPSALYSRSATLNIADDAIPNPQIISLVGAGVQVQAPTVAPPSLTFTPNQPLNKVSPVMTVTVKNTDSTYPLTLIAAAATGDFEVVAGSCGTVLAKSGSCTVGVTFTPTASGTRTGTLSLSTNGSATPLTLILTGTGGANAKVNTATLDLGSANVGGSSPAKSVTLSNSSAFPVNITGVSMSGASASQFAATNNCGTIVLPGPAGNCTVSVIFNPTATGIQTATMTIASDAATPFAPVGLTGTGTTPVVSLSTLSLNFQSQVLNVASAAMPITLKNTGSGALNFSSAIAISGAAAGDFTQTNNCGLQVVAGGSCVINVTFKPTVLNSRIAVLTFTDDAADSPQTVALSGTGVAGFQLSSASLTFGNQQVGTTSAAQMVTLTNSSSTSALTISKIAFSGTYAADFSGTTSCPLSPATLAGGASCTISVYFTPSKAVDEVAALTVSGSGTNSPSVALSGIGTNVPTSTPPFSVTPQATGVSITQGGTATYTFSVAPLNGFNGAINFTCSGPKGSSCSISPNPLTMDGITTKTATLSVNTTGGNGATAKLRVGARSIFLGLLPFSMMGMLLISKRHDGWLVLLLLALCLLLGLAGCGAGTASSSTSSGALAPGTYQITVTAAGNGTTLSPIALSLVVNPQ